MNELIHSINWSEALRWTLAIAASIVIVYDLYRLDCKIQREQQSE